MLQADAQIVSRSVEMEEGCGYEMSAYQIAPEISVIWFEGAFAKDVTIRTEKTSSYVSLVYLLSGKVSAQSDDGNFKSCTRSNSAILNMHRTFDGCTTFHRTDKFALFCIRMEYDYLKQIFERQYPDALEAYILDHIASHEILPLPWTAEIGAVIEQISNGHSPEQLKGLFIASKTYELLSLSLEQIYLDNIVPEIAEKDIACLQRAREILSEQYFDPPKVTDLARMVGINDNKLKRGFKTLYNTTPFAYVQEYRMMKARDAFVDGETSVTTVANQVGYSNPSRFTVLFKKQFGISPKEFRKQRSP